ncbi:MAG: cysteine--tRNA ligase [Clostridia bacterium]|nr:cysteine--tRNA ligase [Clostridia bacterium]
MKIYDTLTRQKEDFTPISGKKVNMYACGITVSGEAHVGHAYQALIYDIIRKFLKKSGYDVTYARNYTDVDDKIIARSKETGIPADRYAAMMIKKTDAVMRRFQVDDPDIWLKATENIDNIIEFTQKLIDGGHAYAAEDGSVYYSVSSFPAYGGLSNRKTDDMLDGVRIENDEKKRSPLDFALWKAAKEGEISWDSPWGKGRPGWHIECSAMNKAAFGDEIDIHGGGRDLIFPHHENEIAQSEDLSGKRFVKSWIHNGLIKVNGQKMSKSLGNSLLLSDLLDRFSADAIKFALLSTSYRNDINITDELFPDAESQVGAFYKIISDAESAALEKADCGMDVDALFDAAMSDDFNTSLAISHLFGLFRQAKAFLAEKDGRAADLVEKIKKTYSLLGLFTIPAAEYLKKHAVKEDVPGEVIALADKMQAARAVKDYATADALRTEISDMGYMVRNTPTGYEITKK